MPIAKFDITESTCVPLPLENIDTDQIFPARFMIATSREGFGEKLFYDWRFLKSGEKNMDFALNNMKFSGKTLVAGKNFGSGSSREHAVWAIYDYGFRVVVSSFFADIFKNNALNNGLLPIVINEELLKKLQNLIIDNPSTKVGNDLEKQTFTIIETGDCVNFEINAYKKECLLKGLDDAEFLLSIKNEIEAYEKNISCI
jgi:3-isopropylmalate/(R)-2-methylmalate dehydratase small subunit